MIDSVLGRELPGLRLASKGRVGQQLWRLPMVIGDARVDP